MSLNDALLRAIVTFWEVNRQATNARKTIASTFSVLLTETSLPKGPNQTRTTSKDVHVSAVARETRRKNGFDEVGLGKIQV